MYNKTKTESTRIVLDKTYFTVICTCFSLITVLFCALAQLCVVNALLGPLGTGFREMLIGIQIFSFTKMRMKMSSAKWRPFCLGLDELTHYFRWLNAKEATPQCTEAASLVSFALSHPFVICHQLNITLYCAYTTTAHAFPFRVAFMPAVRYDLSGGLPTCLWLFIYQDYSVICISKKLM